MSDNKKYLIIPDVHGRTFWKEAVGSPEQYERIIFGGDYVDPYPSEEITPEMALDNLHELSEWCAETDNVTLLLGNHDAHYLYDTFRLLGKGSRYDDMFVEPMRAFERAHRDKIRLAEHVCSAGRDIMISHAGITVRWLADHVDLLLSGQTEPSVDDSARSCGGALGQSELSDGTEPLETSLTMVPLLAKRINALPLTEKGLTALSEVGATRGGLNSSGSIVWADIYEHVEMLSLLHTSPFLFFQIFFHTKMKAPIVTRDFACLDVRRAFVFSDGVLTDSMDGQEYHIG